jgi:agmatine deiminase
MMSINNSTSTPSADGYHFPAEWEPHEATWLTYPHNDDSFPGKLESVYPSYMRFIAAIAQSEKVRINTPASFKERLLCQLHEANIDVGQVEIFERNSNDVWCRDHGPAFVVKDTANKRQKAVIDWEFNAWGGKYPHDDDNRIAGAVAADFGLPVYRPGIVMEGGAVEFNGQGTLITTNACLLNPNRNPNLNRRQIEQYLCDYYGVHQILWLSGGIEGDDTDGHVDDITRFANTNTIITAVETDRNDTNYQPLQENLRILQNIRLLNGRQPDIVELPMPEPVIFNGQRLPASYANFYITNDAVVVPTFKCPKDEPAMQILSGCFPDRKIVCIDSTDIVWGLGSFHCLSQQEPA